MVSAELLAKQMFLKCSCLYELCPLQSPTYQVSPHLPKYANIQQDNKFSFFSLEKYSLSPSFTWKNEMKEKFELRNKNHVNVKPKLYLKFYEQRDWICSDSCMLI